MDRLFIIPPSLEFSGEVVGDAATAAKEPGVKKALLLNASSSELNPDHEHAPMKGSFHYYEKKVNSNTIQLNFLIKTFLPVLF